MTVCSKSLISLLHCVGLPLSVVSVEADSVFSSIIFVDYWPSTATEDALHSQGPNHTSTQVHLLVTCKSGACHLVYAGRGLDSHDVTQLSERFTVFYSTQG